MSESKILTPPPNWVIKTARTASLEGDCNRLRVGAIVWDASGNNWIGCNRAPIRSGRNCARDGHLMVDGHCVRASHAETVALAGRENGGMFLHVTHTPCPHCLRLALESGIVQVTWELDYGNAGGTMELLNESRLFWGRAGEC